MTASRGFKVMLLAFVVLQSYVKASIISIVTVLGVKPNYSYYRLLIPPPAAVCSCVNSCNKARTKTTATASSDNRH